jgi:hypothetical protein
MVGRMMIAFEHVNKLEIHGHVARVFTECVVEFGWT